VPNPQKKVLRLSDEHTKKITQTLPQSSASRTTSFRQETARTPPNRANPRHGRGESEERARARAHLGHTAGRTSPRLQGSNQIKPISRQETNRPKPPRASQILKFREGGGGGGTG
jgi:hypothetical protein